MIAELLAQLGSSSEEIAESLRKAKVVGHKENCHTCPLAIWLMCVGRMSNVSVEEDCVSACYANERYSENLAEALMQFIEHFDKGHYPDLEA